MQNPDCVWPAVLENKLSLNHIVVHKNSVFYVGHTAVSQNLSKIALTLAGWPRHRENGEFGC